MFGYTPEKAIGRSVRMLIPADRQAEEDEVLERIRRGDPVAHFETCGSVAMAARSPFR